MQATKPVFAAVPLMLPSNLIGRRGVEHMGTSSAQDGIEDYGLEHQIVTSYVPRLLEGSLATSARMLAEGIGTTVERVNDYWVSMDFRRPEPDECVFTECDIEVFIIWNGLVDSGVINLAASCPLLRANSHPADRLSLRQFEALVEDTIRGLGLDGMTARMYVIDHMRDSVHVFEGMFLHSWCR